MYFFTSSMHKAIEGNLPQQSNSNIVLSSFFLPKCTKIIPFPFPGAFPFHLSPVTLSHNFIFRTWSCSWVNSLTGLSQTFPRTLVSRFTRRKFSWWRSSWGKSKGSCRCWKPGKTRTRKKGRTVTTTAQGSPGAAVGACPPAIPILWTFRRGGSWDCRGIPETKAMAPRAGLQSWTPRCMLKDVLPFLSHLCEKCPSCKHGGPLSISDNVGGLGFLFFFFFCTSSNAGSFYISSLGNTTDVGMH